MKKVTFFKRLFWLLALPFILSLTSCECRICKTSSLLKTTWELDKYTLDNCLVSARDPLQPNNYPKGRIILEFKSPKVIGNDGCNNYRSDYQNDGKACTFSVSNLSVDKTSSCNILALNRATHYISILKEVKYYNIRDKRLYLHTDDERTLIFYPLRIIKPDPTK